MADRHRDQPPRRSQATARYVRISARKARVVADQIRGKDVEDADRAAQLLARAAPRCRS